MDNCVSCGKSIHVVIIPIHQIQYATKVPYGDGGHTFDIVDVEMYQCTHCGCEFFTVDQMRSHQKN